MTIRLKAKKSRQWVATMADVSAGTVALYEASADAVKNSGRRASLDGVYRALAKDCGAELERRIRQGVQDALKAAGA